VPLSDVIDSLASDNNIVVTRRTGGSMVNGIWVPGPATTFTIPAVSIQPATGMQRVVGGRDMRSDEQGQHTDDVRAIYTYVELRDRTPANDPDQLAFDGGTWIVTRVERWQINSEVIYRCMMTRETRGAS
jgi:uncharacterized protein involved in copper resistance